MPLFGQIAAIKKLRETGKFQKLDDNLKEIAIKRTSWQVRSELSIKKDYADSRNVPTGSGIKWGK